MTYTVHQLATLAGVTARTLRYYDRIGLLSPKAVAKNGYRQYGEQELIRLQQILFFRELEFPLEEIKSMLDHPRFDRKEALRYQRGLLELKRKRLIKIIHSIDKTINIMSDTTITQQDRDLYGSLSDQEILEYKQEAQQRWGHTDAYAQSAARMKNVTPEQIQAHKRIQEEIHQAFTKLIRDNTSPESEAFQALVDRYRKDIIGFYYDCTLEIFKGLGEMYVADSRFTENMQKIHPRFPEMLSKGIAYYVQKHTA